MRKSVKDQSEKILKIDFTPSTPAEKRHLTRMTELLYLKRYGDWHQAANILGIPRQSVEKAFLRVYSKNHFEAVNALEQVIENRQKQLNQKIK
ncbi:MAG: hypothetical protein E2590_12630 [Chryseobacterium sp.]|nr:hypothetical protein [Chryseobacterium sp.]